MNEKLLEDILTEIKTLNQNILVVAKSVNELKEKEKMEILATWIQVLKDVESLRNDISWDSKWSSLKEKDKLVDIFAKSSETIVKKILKLAPNIKN